MMLILTIGVLWIFIVALLYEIAAADHRVRALEAEVEALRWERVHSPVVVWPTDGAAPERPRRRG